MPYKRKQPYRKRASKRKRKRTYVPRGIAAKSSVVKHRYADQVTMDPSTSMTFHTFLANGMFDPDVTGAGHQPYLFDQYSQFYNHYTVLSSKITIVALPTSGASYTTDQYVITLEKSGSSSTITSIQQAVEDPNCQYRVIPFVASQSASDSTLTGYCSVKNFLHQDPMSEDANAGTSTTDPSEKIYWHIGASNFVALSNPGKIDLLVTIDYIARWHEPKPIGLS